jgi:glycosyltransferase involved in cell wall biosynthesis
LRLSQLSIVIPTYNGAAFIERALRSVFAQTLLPLEIIVADDASTDGTPQLVEAVARDSPVPMRLLQLAQNSGGPAHPLNVGIEAAHGDLIAVLDQDDLFVADRLDRMHHAFSAHPDIAFVFSASGHCDNSALPARPCQPPWLLRRLLSLGHRAGGCLVFDGLTMAALLLAYGNFVVGYPGFVFRRRDWQRKGGLDESLRVSSDFDLLCWLCLQGPVAFVPSQLYLRRMHGGNVTLSSLRGALDGARLVHRYLREQPALLRHRIIRRHFRRHFAELLATLGSSGAAPAPFGLLQSAVELWDWDRGLVRAGIHMSAAAVLRHLGRRPRLTPAHAREFHNQLGAVLELFGAAKVAKSVNK